MNGPVAFLLRRCWYLLEPVFSWGQYQTALDFTSTPGNQQNIIRKHHSYLTLISSAFYSCRPLPRTALCREDPLWDWDWWLLWGPAWDCWAPFAHSRPGVSWNCIVSIISIDRRLAASQLSCDFSAGFSFQLRHSFHKCLNNENFYFTIRKELDGKLFQVRGCFLIHWIVVLNANKRNSGNIKTPNLIPSLLRDSTQSLRQWRTRKSLWHQKPSKKHQSALPLFGNVTTIIISDVIPLSSCLNQGYSGVGVAPLLSPLRRKEVFSVVIDVMQVSSLSVLIWI